VLNVGQVPAEVEFQQVLTRADARARTGDPKMADARVRHDRLARFLTFLVDNEDERAAVLAVIAKATSDGSLLVVEQYAMGPLANRMTRDLLRERIAAKTGISLARE
jgi:hypothetical protein